MRRSAILPVALTAIVATAVLSPFAADAAEPAPFQVVRAGDHDLACPALAAEINTLAAVEAGPAPAIAADAAPKKKHGGMGFLKVLGSAAPFIPGVGGAVGGAALSTVSSVATSAEGSHTQAMAEDMMADSQRMMHKAMAGPSPEAQRKDRLTAIFEEKHC